MAKTFTNLTRPSIRKLAASDKLNEHDITFERQANGDGVFTVNVCDNQRTGMDAFGSIDRHVAIARDQCSYAIRSIK